MAITNHDRVGKALELLNQGLKPFVERELKSSYAENWFAEVKQTLAGTQLQLLGSEQKPQWDVAALLTTLWNQWNDVFRKILGHTERTLVSELREVRNKWRIKDHSAPTTPIARSIARAACSPPSPRPPKPRRSRK